MSSETSPTDEPQTNSDETDLSEQRIVEIADAVLDELEERDESPSTSRRGLLKRMAAGGAMTAVGFGGTQKAVEGSTEPAEAQSASGSVGTPDNPVDVYAESVDTGKLGLIDQLIYVKAGSGDYLTTVDPSSSSTPVQDALDYAANNGGGIVELPALTTIRDTGPVQLHDDVDIDANHATIEITGDGNDGLYINNSEALTTNYLQADLKGTLEITHANGENGNTGIGLHLVSGVSNSDWDNIRLTGWNGRALFEEPGAASFQWTINHLYASQTDAGNANGVYDWQGGGAPVQINYVSGYPSDSSSASDSTIIHSDAKSLNINVINVGGSAGRVVNAAPAGSHGLAVRQINWEPSTQNSTPNAVVYAVGTNMVKVDQVVVYNNATTNHVYGQFNGGDNYFGTVHVRGTVNTAILQNRNDTNGTTIFEGQSSDVAEDSGVTLSTPISCLGDLTTVS
jgi:hypothetical protein